METPMSNNCCKNMYTRFSANNCKVITANKLLCALLISVLLNVILIIVWKSTDSYGPPTKPYVYNRSHWKHFSKKEIGNMSTLGRILFLGETPPPPEDNKNYTILVWKYGHTIEDRHVKHFTEIE